MTLLLKPPRPVTAGLLMINLLAVVLLAPHALRRSQTAELLATPASPLTVPRGDLALAQMRIDPNSLETPLFHATRRFFVAPAPSAPSAPPPPNYRFSGAIAIPSKPTVALLVSNDTGAVVRVTTGDDLDGWRVQAVESRRVLLEYAGQTAEIASAARSMQGISGSPRLSQR